MELYINDVRADEKLTITGLAVCDNAGGKLDSLALTLDSTTEGFYSMAPQNGDILRVVEGAFDSGAMYVDELRQRRGKQEVKALAARVVAKVVRDKSWQDVDLLGILEEVANRHKMELKTYGIENFRYRRVRQERQTDFAFLAYRCMLESYSFKVHDGALIVYSEEKIQAQEAQRSFEISGEYELVQPGEHYYDAAQLSTISLSAQARQGVGSRILSRADIPFYSIGEGERFCRGLLQAENKKRKRLTYTDAISAGIAAGSVVDMAGEGDVQGKYVVDTATYNFIKGNVRLCERAVI